MLLNFVPKIMQHVANVETVTIPINARVTEETTV